MSWTTSDGAAVQVNVVDSYTGLTWCGRGLHLLTVENRTGRGDQCRVCLRLNRRRTRAGKPPLPGFSSVLVAPR